MNPMLRDMLLDPVGWMTIAGALVILGIPLVTVFFIRKKMREDDKNK